MDTIFNSHVKSHQAVCGSWLGLSLERQKEFSRAGEETYEKVQDHLTRRFRLPDKSYFVEVKLGGKKVKNKYFIPFSPDGTSEDCEIIIVGESGERWRIHIPDRFCEATYNAQ